LIEFRDYHSKTHENGAINTSIKEHLGQVSITPYAGLPELYLSHSESEVMRSGDWYRNFEYQAEQQRGLDFHEDLFNPLILRFDLKLRRQAAVIASTEPHDAERATEYRQAEITRRRNVVALAHLEDPFAQDLTLAADQYIVSRGDQKTVIAGYHWFSDWGRDTMIALPGLTLPTG